MKARKRQALEERKQAAKAHRATAPNARQEEARLARDKAAIANFLAHWHRRYGQRHPTPPAGSETTNGL